MAEYYAQRANPQTGATLIMNEAMQLRPQGQGSFHTPCTHSRQQATDALPGQGGKIVAQPWHISRISRVDFQTGGTAAPSAIRADPKSLTAGDVMPVH